MSQGQLQFDPAQHGPGPPLACPPPDTADCCPPISTDDEIRFDHPLEQIWICGEEGKPAQAERLHATGPSERLPVVTDEPAARGPSRMVDPRSVQLQNGEAQLTPGVSQRARGRV